MPSFSQVRDAAITALKGALPEGARCEAFEGELTTESVALKRLSRAGAVLVACLGAVNTAEEHSLDRTMRLALGAFCVSTNAAGAGAREADSLPLVQAVIRTVHGAVYGLAGVAPGRVLSVDNMFSADLEKRNITAWGVTWEHHITFE